MSKIIGKWKITEMELWDDDFINAQGDGFFQFDKMKRGSFMFGYVDGELNYRIVENTENIKIEYAWSGWDEMDEASGGGCFELISDDEIHGQMFFDEGDISAVTAKRMK